MSASSHRTDVSTYGRAAPTTGRDCIPPTARRIVAAFEQGRGQGTLCLGAAEPGTELHPTLAYWRDFGRTFVASVCAAIDPLEPSSFVTPEPDPGDMTTYALAAPPMPGAELITPELLAELWFDMGEALAEEAARFDDGIQGYLKQHHSVWNVVGRVCLHLAENKRDPAYPFAFMATYVHKVSRQARPQHIPL